VVSSKTGYEAQSSARPDVAREERARSVSAAVGSVTVTPHNAGGAWLIALHGEHDLSTAALLEQATIGIWQRCTLAVVDLSGAAFIDTTVINWLLSAKRALEASGTGVLRTVEGPSGSFAARLLGLLGLRDELACYPTRQEAFARERDR
jgi:anti-anti-sigma regulatory factor